ncbi:MAG: aminoacyl-tRNA hydrolase [Actinobacteria bacterium]|nr:aminoacyl-tRNA hydrolase [Actinomycetota bacterium]
MSKLLVCLGNTGDQYLKNRHNVGFMVADQLIHDFGLLKDSEKQQAWQYKGLMDGVPVRVIKPQTLMNLSGVATQKVAHYYKIDIADIIVVFDDFVLDLGQVRLRERGSAGTHNGMRSVIQVLGSPAITRLRVGVGPKPSQLSASSFVLSDFLDRESDHLAVGVSRAVDCLQVLIKEGPGKGMSQFNTPVANGH